MKSTTRVCKICRGTTYWLVVLFVIVLAASLTPIAQVSTATILGTVTDPSGAAVPSVTVNVTDVDTNQTTLLSGNLYGAQLSFGPQTAAIRSHFRLPRGEEALHTHIACPLFTCLVHGLHRTASRGRAYEEVADGAVFHFGQQFGVIVRHLTRNLQPESTYYSCDSCRR